jgi:hypothetical protein
MQNFPKKRFDLGEFLAQKGKPKPRRPVYFKGTAATDAPEAKSSDRTDKTIADKGS